MKSQKCLLGSAIFFCSDSKHKMEDELLKLLRQTKEAGGSASLTFTTRDGKMKAKLEVELDPPAPASPSSTPPPPTTSPAPGRGRRRRKGAAAKVKAKARAALHQATRAAATQPPPAPGDASVPPPPPPPLPPPPPAAPTARRIKVVERKASSWPTFSQLDGEGGSVEESQSEVRQVDASSSASSSPPSPAFKSTYCWACLDPHPMARAPPDCPYLTGRRLPWQLQK